MIPERNNERRAGGGVGRPGVLLVGNFFPVGIGAHCTCVDFAARLGSAGWAVLTTSHKFGRLARLSDMLSTVWRRRRDYEVAHVDVFSGAAFVWAEAVCRSLRLLRKPYVLTLHGGGLPEFSRRWPGRVSTLLGSAAAVTTPSRYLLEQMSPYRRGLRLYPNPVDLSAYEFRARRRPEPRLVWLRAFSRIYNPALAPRVLALVASRFPAARLTMVGRDKEDGSLQETRRAAKEHGVGDRITFTGGVEKASVPGLLNGGDIFLNTTNVDNTPVSVLEAMACGMCVVSTNVGGIPYLLEDGKDSLLVPPGDAEAMAAAVLRILTEPGLAERLSRAARAKAEQFDWAAVLPRWERLLTEVGPAGHGAGVAWESA
jgi:glycosyltransferase involved in cell wall biosynthesis